MYDMSSKFNAFYSDYVVLPKTEKNKLYDKKALNIQRLKDGFRPFFFISKGRTNRKCRKSPPWERVSPWWRLFLFFLRIGSNKSCNEKLLFQRTANNFTRWTIQVAERALSIREICSCFLDAELSQNTAALCGNGCDYFIKIFPGGSTDRDIGL